MYDMYNCPGKSVEDILSSVIDVIVSGMIEKDLHFPLPLKPQPRCYPSPHSNLKGHIQSFTSHITHVPTKQTKCRHCWTYNKFAEEGLVSGTGGMQDPVVEQGTSR
jgi:hypothetical protein